MDISQFIDNLSGATKAKQDQVKSQYSKTINKTQKKVEFTLNAAKTDLRMNPQ